MLLLLLCVFRFGVNHVYCWHGLPAYWGGIMPGAPALGPAGQTGKLVYPKPTASIAEVEPSLLWSPAVLAGEAREQSLACRNEVVAEMACNLQYHASMQSRTKSQADFASLLGFSNTQ
jgi:hypothetical protein